MTRQLDWTVLREHFRVRLRARMAEIRAIVERIAAGQTPADALALQFHSLAGIGGTYGYPAVTELARRGEELCQGKPLALDAIHEIAGAIARAGEADSLGPKTLTAA